MVPLLCNGTYTVSAVASAERQVGADPPTFSMHLTDPVTVSVAAATGPGGGDQHRRAGRHRLVGDLLRTFARLRRVPGPALDRRCRRRGRERRRTHRRGVVHRLGRAGGGGTLRYFVVALRLGADGSCSSRRPTSSAPLPVGPVVVEAPAPHSSRPPDTHRAGAAPARPRHHRDPARDRRGALGRRRSSRAAETRCSPTTTSPPARSSAATTTTAHCGTGRCWSPSPWAPACSAGRCCCATSPARRWPRRRPPSSSSSTSSRRRRRATSIPPSATGFDDDQAERRGLGARAPRLTLAQDPGE